MMLPITKVQHFCTHDGPGVRTTVFFKGCPLRCVWCHNPETQNDAPPLFFAENLCIRCGGCAAVCPSGAHRISADAHAWDPAACAGCLRCAEVCVSGALEPCCTMRDADDVFAELCKDAAFYGKTGGVTFSGGEPTVHAGALLPLLRRCKENGISTALETCGYFDPGLLPELTAATDLFLWDVKDTDDRRHRANTGVSNRRILENLRRADDFGARTVLRCILLKSVNFDDVHLRQIARIFEGLHYCAGVELLPYHTYGVSKSAQLGRPIDAREEWVPADDEVRQAEDFLRQFVPVIAH